MDVPGWRGRRWRGIRGWLRRFRREGCLQGSDLLLFLLAEPLAVFREFSFEGLVQASLLYGELLPKLLQGVLHSVYKKGSW
jgi:hypothetical protein